MKNNKKYFFLIISIIFMFAVGTTIVSAADTNNTDITNEKHITSVENTQHVTNNTEKSVTTDKKVKQEKNTTKTIKTQTNNEATNTIQLTTTVKNNTTKIVYDTGKEKAITKNITTANGKPDPKKLGVDYAYADEDGTYTITSSEILRVMKLDSYSQQIYGYTPKYTFFRAEGSNTKYIISREKWNVIARALNSYHVNKGFNALNPPYSIKVNLTGKSRYYPVYYDSQEWINGHQYTCGPTAMSMISQALNCYSSEKKLSGIYGTTSTYGTDEDKIISKSPSVHMKLYDIYDRKSSVKNAILSGKMVFWHIKGHYMCVIGYNSQTDKFLCLNPSGPSHRIDAVQWATWTQMQNTDRKLKDHGYMSVTPCWTLTNTIKTQVKYYYYNMGGKYTTPSNNQYPNSKTDNKATVTVDTPKNIKTTTNQTTLNIKTTVKNRNGQLQTTGKVEIKLNNEVITTTNIKNGQVTYNYKLPAYTPNTVTITATYLDSNNKQQSKQVTNTFYKYTAGRTYTNQTKIDNLEEIILTNTIAKHGDTIKLTAHIYDKNGLTAKNGNVVFKINGKTIKQNGKAIKVKVTNGIATLDYTIPEYSAKDYKLTAVYGNETTRLEDTAILTITRQSSKLTNITTTIKNNKLHIKAKILDQHGKIIKYDTKTSVKINGKTLINKLRVHNGTIDTTIDMSKYKKGTYNITIIVGQSSRYNSTNTNTKITKT